MRMNPTATYANFEILKFRDASGKNPKIKPADQSRLARMLVRQHTTGVFGFDVTIAGVLDIHSRAMAVTIPEEFSRAW